MKNKLLTLFALSSLVIGGVLSTAQAKDIDISKIYPSRGSSMAIGDIVGDKKIDIVYRSDFLDYDGRYIIIAYENIGEGKFKKHKLDLKLPVNYGTFYPTYKLLIGDIDGDGLNDIVAISYKYLAVFKNKGNLKFEEIKLE